jgi:hypothetical protein
MLSTTSEKKEFKKTGYWNFAVVVELNLLF